MARGRRTFHRQRGPRIRTPESPHPQSSNKLMALDLLGLLVPAITLVSSYDNFHVALLDAWKAYQEMFTGAIAVAICGPYMLVKSCELLGLSRVLTFKSWIKIPTCPANIRIYRDTAVVVIISYVLLLDINLSYLWLAIFPVIAIAFIYALCIELELHRRPGDRVGLTDSGSGSATTADDDTTTNTKGSSEMALMAIAALPFWVLLVMAQLDDRAADRFVVSQFLLFLSSTLGALTRMMMRLPVGASPGVAPASELLHKTLLLLLLATAHTVATESLGEDVVLICMPEVVPALLWFSVHLDHDGSIISVDKMKPYRNGLIVLGAPPFAYLATSMDESGLSWCTTVLLSCGVSGLLTYYVVFMLRQWPGQQAGSDVDSDISRVTKKQVGKGKGKVAGSLEEDVEYKKQPAGSLEEAVQLLKFWANTLLIAAAALVLLKYLVALRLGLQEPLVDTLSVGTRSDDLVTFVQRRSTGPMISPSMYTDQLEYHNHSRYISEQCCKKGNTTIGLKGYRQAINRNMND